MGDLTDMVNSQLDHDQVPWRASRLEEKMHRFIDSGEAGEMLRNDLIKAGWRLAPKSAAMVEIWQPPSDDDDTAILPTREALHFVDYGRRVEQAMRVFYRWDARRHGWRPRGERP